jgi:hypothetical protein
MILANAACLLGAHAILGKVATGKAHLDFLFFLVIRFALISAAILCAGMSHTLSAWGLGITGAVAILGLLCLKSYRTFSWPRFPNVGRLLVLLTILVVIRLLLQVWIFAPYNFDALSYHLTKIPEWVRAGGFTREMGVDTHAPFPAGFELVETWWVVFLHHDVLIEMAGVEFLILAFASCYALSIEMGLGARLAYFASFLYVMTPGLHLSATSCLNDCPAAALGVTTMALVYARAPWAWLWLVVGLGTGVKPTYVYALPGFILLVFLTRSSPPLGAPKERYGVMLGVLGTFIGMYWYVRNAFWYGNPIYPVGTKGLVASTGQLKIQFGPSLGSALKNFSDLIQERVYDNFVAYGPLLVRNSGWGAIGFSCGLLALLVAVRRESAFRRVACAFAVSLASVLILVNHDDWYMRFVLFFPALLAISVAKLVEQCRPAVGVAGVALAYQFFATCVPIDLSLRNAVALARQGWRDRSVLPVRGVNLTGDSILYYLDEPIHNRGESYLLYGPDYSRRVVYLRGTTPSELVEAMDRSGTRLLYRSWVTTPKNAVLLDECLRYGLLRQLANQLYERQGTKAGPADR